MGRFKVNREYKYFVFDARKRKIVSGWEFKEDAQDDMRQQDGQSLVPYPFKVYTASYLKKNGLDPYDWASWASFER